MARGWSEPHDGSSTERIGKDKLLTKKDADGNVRQIATKKRYPGKAAYLGVGKDGKKGEEPKPEPKPEAKKPEPEPEPKPEPKKKEKPEKKPDEKTPKKQEPPKSDEAPRKRYFAPATTKAEAKRNTASLLTGKYKDDVSCVTWGSNTPLEVQNEYNETLAEMLEKYPLAVPITKLGSYTDTNDSCGAQCVTSFGLSSGASVKLQINQDHESGGLHGFKRWNLYTPEEVANSGGFTRFNVGASENGISVRSVMIHEYGHAIHARARFLERFGFFSDRSTYNKAKAAQKSVADAYNLAKQNGDIKKLSRYASTKPEEFFAECFAAREDGEKLPSYINKMLDKVIKLGTVRA